MSFEDLDDLLDDTLRLPIGGKVYVIPMPSGEVGLKVQRLLRWSTKLAMLSRKEAALAAKEAAAEQVRAEDRITDADRLTPTQMAALQMDDEAETAYYRDLLGDAYDELMVEVSFGKVKHVATTVSLWVSQGVEAAEGFWASVGSPPEPPAPEVSAAPEDSGAAASTTKPPGSGSGTRTRPTRVAKGKRPAAHGTTSSSTGA